MGEQGDGVAAIQLKIAPIEEGTGIWREDALPCDTHGHCGDAQKSWPNFRGTTELCPLTQGDHTSVPRGTTWGIVMIETRLVHYALLSYADLCVHPETSAGLPEGAKADLVA